MSNEDDKKGAKGNGFPGVKKKVSEEAAIFSTFMNVVKNRVTTLSESPTSEPNQNKRQRPRFGLGNLEGGLPSTYDHEKKMLMQINNNGMGAGLVITLGSFLFLRRGPKVFVNYYNRKMSQNHSITQTGGYTFDPPEVGVQRKPGLIFRTFKLGLDLFVATSMGMYGSAIFTDKHKLMNDLANIPLVEGKSIVSEELCDDFIDVYRHIPKKTWDKYSGNSEPLDAITLFVRNCLKRRAVENQILQEKKSFSMFEGNDTDGLADFDSHPPIPSPGVSTEITIEIEFSDQSEDVDIGMENENEDFSFEGDDSELFQLDNEGSDSSENHPKT